LQLLLDKTKLEAKFQIPEFVLKTQLQISKDFATVGETFPEKFDQEELSYDLILDEVQKHLVQVMTTKLIFRKKIFCQ
jgi:hypothetical protein